jgi:co-chaperonin GroES (HSP10)
MTDYRPTRGVAFVRLHPSERGEEVLASGIIIPNVRNQRMDKIHRGIVVAMGKPALEFPTGDITRPWDLVVGDGVYFVYEKAMQKNREVLGTGVLAVGQEEIQAVIEP